MRLLCRSMEKCIISLINQKAKNTLLEQFILINKHNNIIYKFTHSIHIKKIYNLDVQNVLIANAAEKNNIVCILYTLL